MESMESEFGRPANELGQEIRGSIKKRYADRLQIPYAKGCVLVSKGESVEYWYCEECLTLDGARALVDDFTKQWRPSEETKRPNYSVEAANPSEDRWSLDVRYLNWTSKIVESTAEEKAKTGEDFQVVWTSTKSSTVRKHRFRYQSGWLWSAYSESIFEPAALPDVMAHQKSTSESRRRLGKVWLTPSKIGGATRSLWETAIATALGTLAQQNDGQSAEDALSKRGLHDAALATVRAVFDDVDSASAELALDDQQLTLSGQVTVRPDSPASLVLRKSELPRTPVPASPADGMAFSIASRLPSTALSAFDGQVGQSSEIDLVCLGMLTGSTPQSLYGSASITGEQPARLLRILTSLAPVLTQNGPVSLPGGPFRVMMTEDSKNAALQFTVTGSDAKEMPAISVPAVEYKGRGSILAFRVSQTMLESSGWLPQPTAESNSNPDASASERSAIDGEIRADRQGISADIKCGLPAARRIIAALILQPPAR
ncbi:MAG: hypothetical protein JNM43_04640 [Planctomycetaceae bacterium]|nr:hypothetical protein [Planctomycetaceae bacterium]